MSMNVSIYDNRGQLIKQVGSVTTNYMETTAYKQIDMSSASSGNYYLILNNYNKQLTRQFIKV